MKKIIFILILFIGQFAKGQGSGLSIQTMGYYTTEEYDTVKAILLITDNGHSISRSISALAVRRKSVYIVDRMPPATYSDEWNIQTYLYNSKKPIPPEVIIWDYKLLK